MAGTLFSFMAMAIGGRQLSVQFSTFQILFFRSFVGFFFICNIILFGLAFSISDRHYPTVQMWPWVLAVGTSALSAHYCMARALAIAPATVVVPMDFLRLPLIAVVGFLFNNETIDYFVLLGAVVMLAGNLVNINAKQKNQTNGHGPPWFFTAVGPQQIKKGT